MSDYRHGAYGEVSAVGTRAAQKSKAAIVYVGTAPVHTVEGGARNVNVPVLVNNIAEARRIFGYSDDYAGYTLCEAMYVHFEYKGVGPLVFINVLDPAKHRAGESGSVSRKPKNGRITLQEAGNVILDSISVGGKEKGKDYTVSYSIEKRAVTVMEARAGSLGEDELEITYDSVDPGAVEASDVIGASDGLGLNTGLCAVRNVYQATGCIPSYIACPGFSSDPSVHAAMYANSVKINGHWDAYMFADIPITEKGDAVTFDKAKACKDANGYTKENEKVFFPLAKGLDGRVYHLSVLSAANFQELLMQNDGIPYRSSSNTDCALIENLYLGEECSGRLFDDQIINERLNQNGIASAAYAGGRWAVWGAHSADYDQEGKDQVNVAETNRMMLYYISNDFQHRRMRDVDQPLTANDVRTLVAEEQARLDALVNIGALTYGRVRQEDGADAKSDLMNGDHVFSFDVTATPLAKSLTAKVSWTDDGFATYFEAGSGSD